MGWALLGSREGLGLGWTGLGGLEDRDGLGAGPGGLGLSGLGAGLGWHTFNKGKSNFKRSSHNSYLSCS